MRSTDSHFNTDKKQATHVSSESVLMLVVWVVGVGVVETGVVGVLNQSKMSHVVCSFIKYDK